MTHEYPSNTWLWACPDGEGVIDEARAWIKSENYGHEVVKIIRVEGQIVVVQR